MLGIFFFIFIAILYTVLMIFKWFPGLYKDEPKKTVITPYEEYIDPHKIKFRFKNFTKLLGRISVHKLKDSSDDGELTSLKFDDTDYTPWYKVSREDWFNRRYYFVDLIRNHGEILDILSLNSDPGVITFGIFIENKIEVKNYEVPPRYRITILNCKRPKA